MKEDCREKKREKRIKKNPKQTAAVISFQTNATEMAVKKNHGFSGSNISPGHLHYRNTTTGSQSAQDRHLVRLGEPVTAEISRLSWKRQDPESTTYSFANYVHKEYLTHMYF